MSHFFVDALHNNVMKSENNSGLLFIAIFFYIFVSVGSDRKHGFHMCFQWYPPFARKTLALHESNKPCATCSFSPRFMLPSKFGETDLSNRSICGRAQTLDKKRFVPQQYFNAGFTASQSVAMPLLSLDQSGCAATGRFERS